MGMYTGKTQHGKVFAAINRYFKDVPVGTILRSDHLYDALLGMYNYLFPRDGVKNTTGIQDGVRCLAKTKNSPIERISPRKYKLVRSFQESDSTIFNHKYYLFACKGKKYQRRSSKENKESTVNTNKSDDTEELTQLGNYNTEYNYSDPSSDMLETFPNQYPHRDYITEFQFNEFTSLCPKTGQPDFATIKIRYIPNKTCIETKSLKVYFLAFRQYGSFMETIINKILEDCKSVCAPRWMKVIGHFNIRGGTQIDIEAEYESD